MEREISRKHLYTNLGSIGLVLVMGCVAIKLRLTSPTTNKEYIAATSTALVEDGQQYTNSPEQFPKVIDILDNTRIVQCFSLNSNSQTLVNQGNMTLLYQDEQFDYFVSAAHVLNDESGRSCLSVVIGSIDQQGNISYSPPVSDIVIKSSQTADIALLKVARNLMPSTNKEYVHVPYIADVPILTVGDQLTIAGYPALLTSETNAYAQFDGWKVTEVNDSVYSISGGLATPGFSGSVAFTYDMNSNPVIVGIIVSSAEASPNAKVVSISEVSPLLAQLIE